MLFFSVFTRINCNINSRQNKTLALGKINELQCNSEHVLATTFTCTLKLGVHAKIRSDPLHSVFTSPDQHAIIYPQITTFCIFILHAYTSLN